MAEKMIVSGARGASGADVARRRGHFIGAPVTAEMTDDQVLDAPLGVFNELIEAAGVPVQYADVRAASSLDDGNITLSGAQTIGGVDVVGGDRVLLAYQTSAAENGLWVANAGSWTRPTDYDGSGEAVTGATVSVVEGSQAGLWRLTTQGTITIGTTPQTWRAFRYSSAHKSSYGAGTVAQALDVTTAPLFVDVEALVVPPNIASVRTSGYSTRGIGAASYCYDADVDEAYVAANPRSAFLSANGRGFKLEEAFVTVDMFGALGLALPGTETAAHDDTDALEAAYAWRAANGKGPVYLRAGGIYGTTRDLVADQNGVWFEGDGSRSSKIEFIGDDSDLVDSAFREGGNGIIFSTGFRRIWLYAMGSEKPTLIIVGTQECSPHHDLLINGSASIVLDIMGGGFWAYDHGGAAEDRFADPVHKSSFADIHVGTSTGANPDVPGDDTPSPAMGVRLRGVNGCTFTSSTVTVPPGFPPTYLDPPQTRLGTIGILLAEGCLNNVFTDVHVEGFEEPVVIVGPNSKNNHFIAPSASVAPSTITDEADVVTPIDKPIIRVEATNYPFEARGISNQFSQYTKMAICKGVMPDGSDYEITTDESAGAITNRVAIWQSQLSGDFEVDADTIRLSVRPTLERSALRLGNGTFAHGDTSPSISGHQLFYTQSGSGYTISTFDDYAEGQLFRVFFPVANVTLTHGSGIVLKGGSNLAVPSYSVLEFLCVGGAFVQV